MTGKRKGSKKSGKRRGSKRSGKSGKRSRKVCKKSQKRSRVSGRCVRRSCKKSETRDSSTKRCRRKKKRGSKKGSKPQIRVAHCLSTYKWPSIKRYAKIYNVKISDEEEEKHDRKVCHRIAEKMVKTGKIPPKIEKEAFDWEGEKGVEYTKSPLFEERKRSNKHYKMNKWGVMEEVY